jgi:uncharacterized protein YqeY
VTHPPGLRERLRARLADAMRARDLVAMSVLRATLAAIDNAEAPSATAEDLRGATIEHSPYGVGMREVPRRTLSDADVEDLVRGEVADRSTAAAAYVRAGETQRADRLRAEAAVLQDLLA